MITARSGEILRELFSASVVDARILACGALTEALLNSEPPEGYPPVPGGTLDLQTAWNALLRQALGETEPRPAPATVLRWATDGAIRSRLLGLDKNLRDALVDWAEQTGGRVVRYMMEALEAGFGDDMVALGLALGLVFQSDKSEFQVARGRLAKFFTHHAMDSAAADAWAKASRETLSAHLATHQPTLLRVDQLIQSLMLQEFAELSDYSPAGYEKRYGMLGKTLRKAITAKTSEPISRVAQGIKWIQSHELARTEPRRLSRAEMALRTLTWLHTAQLPDPHSAFDSLMQFYHSEGGFIDWGRNRLHESDTSPDMQKALDELIRRLDETLQPFEYGFAASLKDETAQNAKTNGVIRIESVLERVVGPAAKQEPVLLLILDGMSVAVFRELLQDLIERNWTEIAHSGLGIPKPVLATLPSITAISRRALIRGRLEPTKAGTESGDFKQNDWLFQASGGQARPRLFLQGDLQDPTQGSGLANDVRETILNRKCRVVGVVVNAVDDMLTSGDQLADTWDVEQIKPLTELLHAAIDSERLIILTSDHGHVLDHGTKKMSADADAGDRFRGSDGEPTAGEFEFTGDRVKAAIGQPAIILPWGRDIRYASKKCGYHGGVNPQEMVVPLAILKHVTMKSPDGWEELPPYAPEWWQPGVWAPKPALVETQPTPATKLNF